MARIKQSACAPARAGYLAPSMADVTRHKEAAVDHGRSVGKLFEHHNCASDALLRQAYHQSLLLSVGTVELQDR